MQKFQQCTLTIMDNISDPDITFDASGMCNYVYEYKERLKSRLISEADKPRLLDEIVQKIKTAGKGREYDCLIGVSGGVDSTYTAYIVKKMGLRALAVHLDNGWNSELAVNNIKNTLKNLDLDLYTEVLDWNEFKELQKAFLYSSTPDAEIPTDHAIFATLYKMANKLGIKYLVIGSNILTEGFLPLTWSYGHYDWKYIKAVNKAFGKKSSLRKFPRLRLIDLFYYTFIKRIKRISLLDYVDFKKEEVIEVLKDQLAYVPYQEKHYESVYTRFYQGYIMIEKFKMDKRKTHYSTMICSGLMTKNEALELIKRPPYPSEEMLQQDLDFVLKKFDLTAAEFQSIIKSPVKTFRDYPNNFKIVNLVWKLYRLIMYKKTTNEE